VTSAAPTRTVVLLVEPDDARRHALRVALRGADRLVMPAGSLAEALALAQSTRPQVVVTAYDLPDVDRSRVIEVFRQKLGAPVVVTDSAPQVPDAVEAVRRGASDLVPVDVDAETLIEVVRRALTGARAQHVEKRVVAQPAIEPSGQLLTQSPRMLEVFEKIRLVARTDATALILGETGTGKELVSRAIHERSRRKERPFVAVNCGAFTETLLESELFGHEKGSFTGAVGRRDGLFEMADGGSLFLDELGETSLAVQVNLLRVLEEMAFRRVGGRDLVHVDVRIIAATNVHLDKAVASGKFREDLYYRLNVFPIRLPPLRERMEDVPLLMRHFLDEFATEYQLEPPSISPEAIARVLAYRWPGNVRQLRASCERWVVGFAGTRLREDQLGPEFHDGDTRPAPAPIRATAAGVAVLDPSRPLPEQRRDALAAMERAYFTELLARCGGHFGRTAAAAGVTRRTLYNKVRELDLHDAVKGGEDAAEPEQAGEGSGIEGR
jgi:DNA-binding NtrC family response regulator